MEMINTVITWGIIGTIITYLLARFIVLGNVLGNKSFGVKASMLISAWIINTLVLFVVYVMCYDEFQPNVIDK